MTPDRSLAVGFVGALMFLGLFGVAVVFVPDPPKQVVTLTEVEKEREKSWEEMRAAKQAAEDHYASKVTVIMPRTYIKDADVSISIIKLANGECYMLTRVADTITVTQVGNNVPLLIGTPP